MSDYTLHHGDCLEVMAQMDVDSVDAVVTDPPYGLEFMGKEWDRLDGGGAGTSKPGIGDRPTEWPSFGGAEFGGANPTCATCGGRLRGAKKCGCESPDWRVKGKESRGGGKAASSRLMQDWHQAWATETLRLLRPSHHLLAFGGTRTWHRLACALEDAGFEIRDTLMWLYGSGFPKGKSCLKPAWEPVILARKPGPMRELGIEECRVGFSGDADEREAKEKNRHADFDSGPRDNRIFGPDKRGRSEGGNYDSPGRWPANLILGDDGDEDWRRYFYCAKASREERNAGCEGMEERNPYDRNSVSRTYEGAGSLSQPRSNHHPTVKPLALMRWLVRLVARPGEVVLDSFMGSGTTGIACVLEGREFTGIEKEAGYVEIARRRIDAAAAQLRLLYKPE